MTDHHIPHRARLSFVVVSALLAVSGCAALLGKMVRPPEVRFERLQVRQFTLRALKANVILEITNPNMFKLRLSGYSYALEIAGRKVAEDSRELEVDVPAKSSYSLPISIRLSYNDLLSVAGRAAIGRRLSYRCVGDVNGTALGLSHIRLPYVVEGRLPKIRRSLLGLESYEPPENSPPLASTRSRS